MTDPLAHIRAEVRAQPADQQADYALDLLAFYLDPHPPFFDGAAMLQIKLPLSDLRMVFAMDRRRGRFLSVDALVAARCIDLPVDHWQTHDKITKAISRIRKALAARGLPVTIQHSTGLGYALDAPVSFRFEDAAASPSQAAVL
jgi:hypothetical protein